MPTAYAQVTLETDAGVWKLKVFKCGEVKLLFNGIDGEERELQGSFDGQDCRFSTLSLLGSQRPPTDAIRAVLRSLNSLDTLLGGRP